MAPPSPPHDQHHHAAQPYYLYLAPNPRPHRRWQLTSAPRWIFPFLLLLVIAVVAFFLWPRQPRVRVSRLLLQGVHVDVTKDGFIIPKIFLNITLKLGVAVQNPNFFGAKYKSITVGMSYEGDEIGQVQLTGGKVPARSMAYVHATLELNGSKISRNVFSLLEDLANRQLPLQTETHFDGEIMILLFYVPVKVDMSCSFVIDPEDQVILSQDCDIEDLGYTPHTLTKTSLLLGRRA